MLQRNKKQLFSKITQCGNNDLNKTKFFPKPKDLPHSNCTLFFNISFHEGCVLFIAGSDNKYDVKESQQRRNQDDSFMG
jgi:hypothetical protein